MPAKNRVEPRTSLRAWVSAATAPDIVCITALIFSCAWIYGADYRLLGFYADDVGFLNDFRDLSVTSAIETGRRYVTGRNLHILWQYLLFLVTGTGVDSLPALHLWQAIFSTINVLALYILLRACRVPAAIGLFATAIFAFNSNHGEVHFWLSSFPMNLISTLLILALLAVLAASVGVRSGDLSGGRSRLTLGALVLLSFAVFTYDQVVALAATAFFAIAAWNLFNAVTARERAAIAALAALALTVLMTLVWLKLKDPGGGPTLSHVSLSHLLSNVSISLNLGGWRHASGSGAAHASAADTTIAKLIALMLFAAGLAALLAERSLWRFGRDRTADAGATFRFIADPLVSSALLAAGGAAAFLLAMLPAYLWFISPRHMYLPGIGVAAVVAGIATLILLAWWRASVALLLTVRSAVSIAAPASSSIQRALHAIACRLRADRSPRTVRFVCLAGALLAALFFALVAMDLVLPHPSRFHRPLARGSIVLCLCIAVAGCVNWGRAVLAVRFVISGLVAAVLATFCFVLIRGMLIEKRSWVTAFQAKTQFYQDRNGPSGQPMAELIVLDGMPMTMPFGGAPLGYQNFDEPQRYRAPGSALRAMSGSALVDNAGVLAFTDDHYGSPGFVRYWPKDKVWAAKYLGIGSGRIEYSVKDYAAQRSPCTATTGGSETAGAPGSFAFPFAPATMSPDEVLAVLPLVRRNGGIEPVKFRGLNGRLQLAMAVVGSGPVPTPAMTSVRCEGVAEAIAGVDTYATGPRGSRLMRRIAE